MPRVAAATGTPSCAPANAPTSIGWPIARIAACAKYRPHPEHDPEADVGRVVDQVAQVQRRAQPDEEQRSEKAFGHREQLVGQSPRLSDRGHCEAEREPGQHDRDVRLAGQRRQREQDAQLDPEFQGELRVVRRVDARVPGCRCVPGNAARRTARRRRSRPRERRPPPEPRGRDRWPTGGRRCRPRRRSRPAATSGARPDPTDPSESTMGRTSAADDDAISTPYRPA